MIMSTLFMKEKVVEHCKRYKLCQKLGLEEQAWVQWKKALFYKNMLTNTIELEY
jgi:hypothetical protein